MDYPVALEIPKPVENPKVQYVLSENTDFPKNHIGLSIGPSNFKKNEDSLELLGRNNVGGENRYTKTSGRFLLFYERDFSNKYTLGIAAGAEKGGGAEYDNGARTLSINPKPITATFYLMRNFSRHFGLYAGGGVDSTSFVVDDPGNIAGISGGNAPFKGKETTAHAEAGMVFSLKNLSLRFSLRRIFSGNSGDITTNLSNGTNQGKYKLIVKNNKTLGAIPVGQSLASNEKPFKIDFGGTAAAVAFSYSFANW